MNAAEILVLIISATLGIFLIAGIVLLVLLIRVTMQIRRIAARAETLSEMAATMASNKSKVALGTMVFSGLKKAYQSRKSPKDKGSSKS